MEPGEGVEEIVPALRRDAVDEAAGPPAVDARLGQRARNALRLDSGEGQGDRRVTVVVPVVQDIFVGGAVEGRRLHAALPRPAFPEMAREDVVPLVHLPTPVGDQPCRGRWIAADRGAGHAHDRLTE